MKPSSIHRRRFLRGAAGASVALPQLLSFGAQAADVPRRMVCVGTNFGFVPKLFFPEQTGRDYALSPLLSELKQHREQFTVFTNLDHGAEGVGGHTGVHAYLSGVRAKNARSMPERNVTMDQKAADFVGNTTRFSSLQITSGSEPNNLLSWGTSGVALPPIQDLRAIFNLLFQQAAPRQTGILQEAYRRQKSVLDLVEEDAKRLRRRVGREDKETLDQYFTSVRELERTLTQSEAWLNRPKPKVRYALPKNLYELDFIDRVPLYYDLMVLALQTDSTRVLTLELSELGRNAGGFPITRGYHQLTHHGKVESYLDELEVIERFHTRQFGRFLDQLAAVNEANGKTLLDNTMSLLGSGMGNASSHSNKCLPLLLAGGGFKHGQHLRFEPHTPAGKLFVSMLQGFGLETDRFNLATGTLPGLEQA